MLLTLPVSLDLQLQLWRLRLRAGRADGPAISGPRAAPGGQALVAGRVSDPVVRYGGDAAAVLQPLQISTSRPVQTAACSSRVAIGADGSDR